MLANIIANTLCNRNIGRTFQALRPPIHLPYSLCAQPPARASKSLGSQASCFRLCSWLRSPFSENNWAEYATKQPLKARGHLASMITMAHNVMARKAPDVSFIHNYPGGVNTGFGKGAKGLMAVGRTMLALLGPLFLKYRSPDESSILQLYGATSAAFPPALAMLLGFLFWAMCPCL